MNKKLVFGSVGVVVLASAVYVGGVYYTGVKINEYLGSLENNTSVQKQINKYIPESKLSSVTDSDSMFTEQGRFVFSIEDEKYEIPYTIKKGFGSAKTVIDTKNLNNFVENNGNISFVPGSVKSSLEFDSSIFSSNITGQGYLKADYKDTSKGNLDSSVKIDISNNEKVLTHVNVKNLQDDRTFSVSELEIVNHIQGISEIKDVGDSSLTLKGFKTNNYKIDNLRLASKAVNKNAQGDFDLNVTLVGDALFEYLNDFDIDFTISKMNTRVLEGLSNEESFDANYKKFLSSLTDLTVNKLNGRVGKIVAFFTGVPNIDKFNLKSQGKFSWNPEQGIDSLKGTLTVKSDSNKNAEQFFVEKDGSFESVLKIENNRLSVNGNPLL